MRTERPRPSHRPTVDSPPPQPHQAAAAALYEALYGSSGMTAGQVRSLLPLLDDDEVDGGWALLARWGTVEKDPDGRSYAVDPDAALAAALADQHRLASDMAQAAQGALATAWAIQKLIRPAATRAEAKAKLAVEEFADRCGRDRALAAILKTVQQSAWSLHPGPIPEDLSVLEDSLVKDAATVRRGVAMRAIYPRAMLGVPHHRQYLQDLAAAGVSVRLIDQAPYDLLIFDRHSGYLPGAPDDASASMTVITGYVAQFLVAVYEDCWRRAVPLARASASPQSFTPGDLAIIRLMREGYADAPIARKLGCSRRTLQRWVAKQMKALGVESRFELAFALAQQLHEEGLQ